jgi:hypothetical protein
MRWLSLFLACQLLNSVTNLRECEDQSWFNVQAVPVFRFDWCKVSSHTPQVTRTPGWRPLVYYTMSETLRNLRHNQMVTSLWRKYEMLFSVRFEPKSAKWRSHLNQTGLFPCTSRRNLRDVAASVPLIFLQKHYTDTVPSQGRLYLSLFLSDRVALQGTPKLN